MLVAQNSLGPVCPVPLTVRGRNSMGVDENLPRRDPEIEGLLMPPDGPTADDVRATNPHT